MDRKDIKRVEGELRSNCITLNKFLVIYCGIDVSTLKDANLTHKDVKYLIPGLKRMSFEDLALDMKKLYVGDVIAVEDANGNVAPYICPEIDETLELQQINCKIDNLEEDIYNLLFNGDLKRFELVRLCNRLKTYNKKKELSIAKKVLRTKKTKKTKIKIKIKEIEIQEKEKDGYDEY